MSIFGLILFWLNLICSVVVAFVYGFILERSVTLALILISFVSLLITIILPTSSMHVWFNFFDWVILLGAWYLALTSDRYWPIWFAAMQSLSILTLLIPLFHIGIPKNVFINLAGLWALPALMVMSRGTILDWRERASASPINP